jgi:hypothetical protein
LQRKGDRISNAALRHAYSPASNRWGMRWLSCWHRGPHWSGEDSRTQEEVSCIVAAAGK